MRSWLVALLRCFPGKHIPHRPNWLVRTRRWLQSTFAFYFVAILVAALLSPERCPPDVLSWPTHCAVVHWLEHVALGMQRHRWRDLLQTGNLAALCWHTSLLRLQPCPTSSMSISPETSESSVCACLCRCSTLCHAQHALDAAAWNLLRHTTLSWLSALGKACLANSLSVVKCFTVPVVGCLRERSCNCWTPSFVLRCSYAFPR